MKICFAFLVIDNIQNPEIWDNYFETLVDLKIDFKIIVHARI
jgi:hypothetical protein